MQTAVVNSSTATPFLPLRALGRIGPVVSSMRTQFRWLPAASLPPRLRSSLKVRVFGAEADQE
jgi:hypothetical protein